ncbi:MAG: hypothetical protein AAF684_06885, partial [Pseudomonadota bacterium]
AFQMRRRTVARATRAPLKFLREIYARWSPLWQPADEEFDDVLDAWSTPEGVEAAIAYYWDLPGDARDADLQRMLRRPFQPPSLLIGGMADGALGPSDVEIVDYH